MVLIISSLDDQSTNSVIDWLRFYKVDFIRISEEDTLKFETVKMSDHFLEIDFSINGTSFKISDFKAFWYRRSYFRVFFDRIDKKNKVIDQVNAHLKTESTELYKLFLKYIREKSINNIGDVSLNKLEVSREASRLGLKIPDSFITNSKCEVGRFMEKYAEVITKNFSQGVFISDQKGNSFMSGTKVVTQEVYDSLPDTFFYTLFQERVEKLFELRVFYLCGEFYSSAIFSQNDPQTAVDFRNYNFEKPNRVTKYKMPQELEAKLTALMDLFGLRSGSLDLMVSSKNEYVFLEVNPIGQFAQVSMPCHYYLEEKLAKQLQKIANHGTE